MNELVVGAIVNNVVSFIGCIFAYYFIKIVEWMRQKQLDENVDQPLLLPTYTRGNEIVV